MKKIIIVFLLASLFISCKNRQSPAKIKTDESAPDRIAVKTKEGSEESVPNRDAENSPEYDDVIRIIEGSYNESGVESPDKITIKYVGNGEAEINANWQMFHEIKRADVYFILNGDFLREEGDRGGLSVEHKVYFKDGLLQYEFYSRYCDFDDEHNPINVTEERRITALKKIKSAHNDAENASAQRQ